MTAPLREQDAAAARAALRPWLTYPAWAAMALVLMASLALPARVVAEIAPYPFFLSLIFLGLPHGAWDHRVIAAARGSGLSLRHLLLFCAGYGLLVAAYGVLWFAAPALAFVVFITLSWLHWGQGDAAYLRVFQNAVWPPRLAWLVWLVRGGAPIVLPILRFPDAFARIAGGVSGLFGQTQTDWLPPPGARLAGLAVLAGLVAAYLLHLRRIYGRGDNRARTAARDDAAEIALLYLVFALANPLLAVGIYFCFWHGARHIGRLVLLDRENRARCARGQVGKALARFGAQCFPILLASLALLAGVYVWLAAGRASGTLAGTGLFVYLALIAALTFPHFFLVCWLDAQPAPD